MMPEALLIIIEAFCFSLRQQFLSVISIPAAPTAPPTAIPISSAGMAKDLFLNNIRFTPFAVRADITMLKKI